MGITELFLQHHRALMHSYFYLLCRCLCSVFFSYFQAPFLFFFFFLPLRHFGIEITKAVQASLFCRRVPSFSCENGATLSFAPSCNKLIFPSLCAPSFFFFIICVSKAARGAWKWWQEQARLWTGSVFLQSLIESAQLKGWQRHHLFMSVVLL